MEQEEPNENTETAGLIHPEMKPGIVRSGTDPEAIREAMEDPVVTVPLKSVDRENKSNEPVEDTEIQRELQIERERARQQLKRSVRVMTKVGKLSM